MRVPYLCLPIILVLFSVTQSMDIVVSKQKYKASKKLSYKPSCNGYKADNLKYDLVSNGININDSAIKYICDMTDDDSEQNLTDVIELAIQNKNSNKIKNKSDDICEFIVNGTNESQNIGHTPPKSVIPYFAAGTVIVTTGAILYLKYNSTT